MENSEVFPSSHNVSVSIFSLDILEVHLAYSYYLRKRMTCRIWRNAALSLRYDNWNDPHVASTHNSSLPWAGLTVTRFRQPAKERMPLAIGYMVQPLPFSQTSMAFPCALPHVDDWWGKTAVPEEWRNISCLKFSFIATNFRFTYYSYNFKVLRVFISRSRFSCRHWFI